MTLTLKITKVPTPTQAIPPTAAATRTPVDILLSFGLTQEAPDNSNPSAQVWQVSAAVQVLHSVGQVVQVDPATEYSPEGHASQEVPDHS